MKSYRLQFKNINFHKLISLDKTECMKVERLHKQLFNTSAKTKTGCKSCYQDAYFTIKNHLKITIMSKFELKANALLDFANNPIKGVPIHVTNANMTDAIARKILARSMNYAKFFSRLPEQEEVEAVEGGKTQSMKATDAIDYILSLEDVEEVSNAVEGDERKTVVEAAKKRVEELSETE